MGCMTSILGRRAHGYQIAHDEITRQYGSEGVKFAGCIGISPVISTQFTLEMCLAASNHEQISLKTPTLGFKVVQGH